MLRKSEKKSRATFEGIDGRVIQNRMKNRVRAHTFVACIALLLAREAPTDTIH